MQQRVGPENQITQGENHDQDTNSDNEVRSYL